VDPDELSEMTGLGMVTAVSPLDSTDFALRLRRYGKVAERRREIQLVAMGYEDAKVEDGRRSVVRRY
jgi:hypothetical protein